MTRQFKAANLFKNASRNTKAFLVLATFLPSTSLAQLSSTQRAELQSRVQNTLKSDFSQLSPEQQLTILRQIHGQAVLNQKPRRLHPQAVPARVVLSTLPTSQKPAGQQAIVESPSLAQSCVKTAGKALAVTIIATGIGCVADVFMTAGAACISVYIPTAMANLPTAAAAGCAAGIVSPKSAPTITSGVPHINSPTETVFSGERQLAQGGN